MVKKVYITDYQKWDLIARIQHRLERGPISHAMICSVAYLVGAINKNEYEDLTEENEDID